MITKDQYEEYKRLVEEYEQAEFEDGMRQAEDDLGDEGEEDNECDWCGRPHWECRCEQIMNCTCGAYTKTGAHVADCICGAG
jgi:hypothetical protein